jgi:hypothetical protein
MARAAWLASLLLLVAAWTAHAQQRTEAPEASVKAAYLFRFAGYIEWSPSEFETPEAPLVMAVSGAEDVAAELARIAPGRGILGHPVTVRKLAEGEPLKGVHMLFVGRDSARLAGLLRSAPAQGAITVTDADRGLEMGAAISFVPVGDRMGFEVSLDSAGKSGHRISSRMLNVARRVVARSPG